MTLLKYIYTHIIGKQLLLNLYYFVVAEAIKIPEEGPPTGAIVGAVVGVLVLSLIVVIVVIIYRKWNR